CAPLIIKPSSLHGISYPSPVASAQVKSSILLAGLYADGETSVTEPTLSRDHTERMLRGFGADINSEGATAVIKPAPRLQGQKIDIPGDISSAAYFITAALIVPGSRLLIKNVNTNPTRAGILSVYKAMGADITLINEHEVSGEPVADLLVSYSELSAVDIGGDIIPSLIDELPVIAVACAAANGTSVIRDAAELKVKESDRIKAVAENLSKMGADITPTDDGWIINGGAPLSGAMINTCLDHRIAMSFAVAGLIASGETTFDHPECIDISYPAFFETLAGVING
ncbi:MAG: 3-phosphoshikimate 1-carboxyvinyltransferase, partial [Lachnospiraceae bacterium]|nr:3-phosphoshikimate 1-carboxyvinyltransferase [Lachnospiraceae bacterium]